MEKDDEMKGEGNSYTTLYRGYDSRVSRWWSVDPEERQFPELSPYNNNENNPIINADPDGDCPWCAGAAIAAGLDIGLQLVEIGLTDKKLSEFSVKSVFVSAASGAIGVGIATKIDKFIKVAKIAGKTAAAIKLSSGAAVDATTSSVGQLVKKGKVSGSEVLVDVIAGGLAGKVAGDVAEKALKKSKSLKVLNQQADRAARLAKNTSKVGREIAAKTTAEKAAKHGASRGAAAGVAGSGAGSEIVKRTTGIGEDKNKK